MITKNDGRIDWNSSAVAIERLVRGLNPWPSAFTSLNGKGLKIWKSQVVTENAGQEKAPGCVLAAGAEGLDVQTGDGVLRITELQLEGKKRMAAGDFLRGHGIPAGTVLGA
jgi:methionyl-tRNA formyltransferase